MTLIRLRDIDYLGLAESFTMTGFSVHQTFERDPEIYRFTATEFLENIDVATEHYSENDLVTWLVDVAAGKISRNQLAIRLRCTSGLAAA